MKNNLNKFRGINHSMFPVKGLINGATGYFFVSIGTKGRKNYFGEVITHNSDMLDLLDKIDPENINGVHIFMGDGRNPGIERIDTFEGFEKMMNEITEGEPEGNTLFHLDIELSYTPIGEIARKYWEDIPRLYPYVSLDATVLMPDMLHGILSFNNPKNGNFDPGFNKTPAQKLDMVIKGYKGAVMNYAKLHKIEFEWQSRYFDNHLKSREEIEEVRQYIFMNPLIWAFTNQDLP